jgi:hypothetical protein
MFWADIRRWAREAWVCRVSLVSTLVGFILLVFVAQARDLFLEFPNFSQSSEIENGLVMSGYAVRFAVLVLIFWALPVHASARIGLNRVEWLTSPYGSVGNPADLETVRHAFALPVVLFPRLLGVFCFVAAIASVAYTGFDLLTVPPARNAIHQARIALIFYLVALLVFGVVFTIYVVQRRKWFERVAQSYRRAGRALVVPPRPTVARGPESAGILGKIDRITVWFLFLVLLAVLATPAVLDFFPRLLLLPILLGAWVPLIGWIGRRSHATKMPLIATAVLALMTLSYVIGDSHDVVPKPTPIDDAHAGQINIAAAVAAWQKENQCSDNAAKCPSPIIVASAGGANRAAFMTASALGLLLDASCFDQAQDGVQYREAGGLWVRADIRSAAVRNFQRFRRFVGRGRVCPRLLRCSACRRQQHAVLASLPIGSHFQPLVR